MGAGPDVDLAIPMPLCLPGVSRCCDRTGLGIALTSATLCGPLPSRGGRPSASWLRWVTGDRSRYSEPRAEDARAGVSAGQSDRQAKAVLTGIRLESTSWDTPLATRPDPRKLASPDPDGDGDGGLGGEADPGEPGGLHPP